MAIPRADLGVVDPVASCVTKRTLVSFPRFMRLSGYFRFGPALVVFGVVVSALLLFHAPAARAQCGTASSTPCPPTPTPVHAFLSLDVTSGDATTVINVTGGQFLPNEQISLYWDDSSKVAGGATADGGGSFNTRVKPFSADAPGLHKLCATVPPNPCANFTLLAPVTTPSPSPSPSESPSPTPETGPTTIPTPSSTVATLNGFNVIMSPPFVFLPIVGGLAILLSLGYWLVSYMRRPLVAPLPSAAVVHRATRPDYRAGFGTPPPGPAPAPEPSAWNEPMTHAAAPAPEPIAQTPPPQPPPAEPSPSEWGPPVEWGTGSGDWGFPEPPEVDESPEIPQPGD